MNKDVKGEVLIAKVDNKPNSEFVLAGIFRVDTQDFFMTSDGKWNQKNYIESRFEDVQPTCNLILVIRDPDFIYSTKDFPSIIANTHAIENQANPQKKQEHDSILLNNPVTIKLTHLLFAVWSLFFLSFKIT